MNLYYDLGNYTKELRKKYVELNKRETRLLHYQRNKYNENYIKKRNKHIYSWNRRKRENNKNKKRWDIFYKSIKNILLNKIKVIHMEDMEELIKTKPLIKINYFLKDDYCLLCKIKYDNIHKHKKSIGHKRNYKKYQELDIYYYDKR